MPGADASCCFGAVELGLLLLAGAVSALLWRRLNSPDTRSPDRSGVAGDAAAASRAISNGEYLDNWQLMRLGLFNHQFMLL